MTQFPPRFYRIAGIASVISALTTLMLIFLPAHFAPIAEGLAGRMQRVADPIYQLRAWTYLLHPFLVFTAALGIAVACCRAAPALALAGLLGFLLWAMTEAGQQTLTLFAFDDWRRAWLAGDAVVRASMEMRAAIYDGLWDSAYALLLFGFIIGNAAFAAILLRSHDILSKVVGGFFAAAAILSLFLLSGEMGGPALPGGISEWAYPAIQPLGRVLIGLWLLRMARRCEPRLEEMA